MIITMKHILVPSTDVSFASTPSTMSTAADVIAVVVVVADVVAVIVVVDVVLESRDCERSLLNGRRNRL
jgi:hypothetical protein